MNILPRRRFQRPLDMADNWLPEKHGLTQGSIGTFLSCPEKFRLGVQLGLKPRGGSWSTPLSFGSAFHDVMALTLERVGQFSSALKNPAVLADVSDEEMDKYYAKQEESIIRDSPMRTEESLRFLRSDTNQARIMLKHYFRIWKKDFAELEWVGLEKEFNIPSPPVTLPFPNDDREIVVPLRGKMDGVYRKNGKLWLFETKTKSYISDHAVLERLPHEIQVQLYLYAISQIYGEEPIGVLYNLVRRPQLRQKKSESDDEFLERIDEDVAARPDDYFLRYEAAITQEEMDVWRDELHSKVELIINWYHNESFHYRNSSACTQIYGACDYLPICSRNAWNGYVQKDRPYGELGLPDILGETNE